MTVAEIAPLTLSPGDVPRVGLSADQCLKCNVCNTVCPVLPVTDLFPGPKYCGPQAQRFRSGHPVETWVDYCSGFATRPPNPKTEFRQSHL